MRNKYPICLCFLIFLLSVALSAFAGEDPRLPLQPRIALYCPPQPDRLARWTGSGLNPFAPAFPLAGSSAAQKHLSAASGIDFGTVEGLSALNFRTESFLTPYLGARFGLSDPANDQMVVPKKVRQTEKDTFLPYRVGFGFGCNVDKNLNLNLGYGFALPTQFLTKDAFRSGLQPPQQGDEISLRIKLNF